MAKGKQRREHPIIAGVAALVGVAVVVGLVLGGGAVFGARSLGLDGSASSTSTASAHDTLYIPSATDGSSTPEPYISIPGGATGAPSTTLSPDSSSPTTATGITLRSAEDTVASMGRIDLSGSYPGGEGAILQVQQYADGQWTDFYAVSAPVNNEQFATYVQTGIVGKHRFRVLDPDTNAHSNPITVTVQ